MIKLSIRLAGFVAAAGLSLACHAQAPKIQDLRQVQDAQLQRQLEGVVRELGLEPQVQSRRLALAVVDVTEGATPRYAAVNGDEMLYAASLPKVAILLAACAEAEAGRFPLDAIRLQAMTNMIRFSSNEDATRVLNWVGGPRLLEILQSDRFRLYDASLGGGLWVGKAYGNEGAFQRDPLRNLSHGATVHQVARLYTMLAQGQLLNPTFSGIMKEALSKPGIQHKFVKGLQARPGVTIYRKSGSWKDFHADSALVEYGDRRYVLVGLAEHREGGDWLVKLAPRLHDILTAPAPALAAR